MKKTLILTLTGALILLTPGVALAQTASPVPTTEARGAAREAATQDRITLIKTKADAEIVRRIASINELITRIRGLKRLTDSDKANLVSMANSMIANLNTLKTKIDGDTDLTTLRADQKSIFDQYRIYMLFMPQLRIMTAADRMAETADLMSQVSVKLQARINGDASLTALLNDANTKISEAKTLYTSAETDVAGLTPDNGDAGKMNSNKEALQDARVDLQKGATDLKAARDDFQKIITSLKATTSKP